MTVEQANLIVWFVVMVLTCVVVVRWADGVVTDIERTKAAVRTSAQAKDAE